MAILWRPISELPDHLKDGREVLVWKEETFNVVTWLDGPRWWDRGPGWVETSESAPIDGVAYFAELNAPTIPNT